MNPKDLPVRSHPHPTVAHGQHVGRAELDAVTRELQLHQIELEEQNRALRDAQSALEESRNRYADLYDFAPVAYCTLDERGCIREVNLTGASMLGRDRLALIGAPLLSVVRMDDPALFWRHIAQCRKTGAAVSSELSFTTADARSLDVQAISTPAFDAAGGLIGLRTALSDISTRKLVERERDRAWGAELSLRRQLERIDQAMIAVTRALVGLRGAGNLDAVLRVIVEQALSVVDATYAAFGSVTADGAGFESKIEVGVDPGTRGQLSQLVCHGEQTLGALRIAGKRSGADFDADDRRCAEMLARRVGVALEIARLHDAAEAAVEARDHLLAIVSHDLRNPLSIVALNASLIARSEGGDPRAQARVIEDSAARMSALIKDLLQAATIEAGEFTIEATAENPARLVEEWVEAERGVAAARGIRLERDVAPGLQRVHCDRERVRQVLTNLLENALRFTPAGGEVRVAVTGRGPDVRFAVSDMGCGIAASELPRLFDRYWKGRTQGRQGTGLGLHIAQGIVQAHGGTIWVESAPGVGTTFFFTLPVSEASDPLVPSEPPPQVDEERLRGLRVMLVDDEAGAVKALGYLLGGEGLVVSEATSGEQCLARIDQERPDALLLDMEMPGMTGLELLERVRARRPELPAVVMSGYTPQQKDVRQALLASRVGYVDKPIDLDRLLSVLARIIDA
jgi:PAS domain S-box-containing protein